MILLYASPHEVKWVDYVPRYCIGVGATRFKGQWRRFESRVVMHLDKADKVVLFGSCGRLDSNLRDFGELIIPGAWMRDGHTLNWITVKGHTGHGITTDHSVKTKEERERLFRCGFYCVDMESYHVAKLCQELDVPFVSVRYMIDRCDRKAMPPGINHFWRKYQHKRMQLKFNQWLREEVK